MLLLVACAAILITVGYRAFPPSVFGKANYVFSDSIGRTGPAPHRVGRPRAIDPAGSLRLLRCGVRDSLRISLQHRRIASPERGRIGQTYLLPCVQGNIEQDHHHETCSHHHCCSPAHHIRFLPFLRRCWLSRSDIIFPTANPQTSPPKCAKLSMPDIMIPITPM